MTHYKENEIGSDSLLLSDTYKMDKEMKYHALHQVVTCSILFICINATFTQTGIRVIEKANDESLLGQTDPKVA